jgi:phospholipid transport system substrate-binding protein
LINPVLLAAYAILLIFSLQPAALAQAEADAAAATVAEDEANIAGASAVIDSFHDSLIDILKRSNELGLQGRADELYPILQKHMNLRALGIGAVGRRSWSEWEPEQQELFIDVFTKFMASTYASRFKEYNNQDFQIVGNRPGPRSSVIIMTEVHSKLPDVVNIHYLMINRNDAWAIADTFLDGAVSEVAMRRSDFSGVLKTDGFDALVAAVEDKTASRLSQ